MGHEQEKDASGSGPRKAGFIMLGIAAIVLVASVAYNLPGLGDSPADDEASAGLSASVDELRAAAENASQGDARPWQELGFVQFQRGEFGEATRAYERAVSQDTSQAVLWSALGEARVMASERDPMPTAALEAFRKAIAIDPEDPRSRYFLNVQTDLEGDHEGAIAGWLDLLSDTPPGAPWETDLIRTIQQIGAINSIEVEARLAAAMDGRQLAAGPTLPGPTQEQIAAAGAMRPSEQRNMAEDMVSRLEQRLAGDPTNLDGWLMLIRSRMTLGEQGKAQAALEDAVTANPDYADNLREEARKLGVK